MKYKHHPCNVIEIKENMNKYNKASELRNKSTSKDYDLFLKNLNIQRFK